MNLTPHESDVLTYLYQRRDRIKRPVFSRIGYETRIASITKLQSVPRSLRSRGLILYTDGDSRSIQVCEHVHVTSHGAVVLREKAQR